MFKIPYLRYFTLTSSFVLTITVNISQIKYLIQYIKKHKNIIRKIKTVDTLDYTIYTCCKRKYTEHDNKNI